MIKQENGIFYIGEAISNNVAEITFEENKHIIIDHTYVDPSLRGQGIALQLVNKVVEYAREKNKKIIPECSYAKKVLIQDEYKDIIK